MVKKVFSSPNSALVHNLKNVLELRGIRCVVGGELRAIGMGELPVNDCWAELWVFDELRFDEAVRVIEGETDTPGESWDCESCGEAIAAPFDLCWKCGAERLAS